MLDDNKTLRHTGRCVMQLGFRQRGFHGLARGQRVLVAKPN
jgi:hypothetical protein